MERAKRFVWENKYSWLFGVLGMALCLWTISNELAIYGNTIRIVLCVICGIAWFNIKNCLANCLKAYDTPIKKITIVIVAIIAAFGIACSFYIKSESDFYSLECLRDFLITFIWNTPIVLFLSLVLIKLSSKYQNSEEDVHLKPLWLILGTVGIILPCLLCLYAFNPGITSYDSVWCMAWSKLIGTTEMIEWHSPFYILILKIFLGIWDSAIFLVIAQCIYFAIIFMKGLNLLKRVGIPTFLLIFFYVFVALNFSNIIQLITVWKDIPFMISLLWLTILLVELAFWEEKSTNSIGWSVQIVVAMIFTSYFRHNGLYVVITAMIFLLFSSRFHKKMLITVVSCFVIMIIISGPFFSTLKIESSNGQKYMGLFNDIAYTYYNSGNSDLEIVDDVNEILSNEPMLTAYDVYQANASTNALKGYTIPSFLKLYFRTLKEYPQQIIYALLARTQYIWAVAKPENAMANCVNYLGNARSINYYGTEYNATGIKEREQNALTEYLTGSFTEWTERLASNILFWRTALFSILTLIAFSATISCGGRIRCWIPYVPILLNNLILFASTGSPDYRYYWPSVVIGLFLCLLAPAVIKHEEACKLQTDNKKEMIK